MITTAPQDELTRTVVDAVQALSQTKKAELLLDTALNLIVAGKWVDSWYMHVIQDSFHLFLSTH